jgi:uncharacterized protein YdeI (YjbR/CyaY-like superfamily)
VPDDLGDTHVGDIFCADNTVESGLLHLQPTEPKGSELRQTRAKLGEELRSIVVSACFTSREKDARIGGSGDGTSVDFSGGDCMAGSAAKSFRAVLEPLGGELGWVVARLPFDVQTAWRTMVRLRVKVEIGGEVFRTSLFPDAQRGGHFVLVNKAMQKAAGARVGGMVDLTIAPDLDERAPVVPPELMKLLKTEKTLAKWFATLSEARRYEIGKWINGVKSTEARQRRAEQMAEWLMLAMEGEKELPPVLEVAFRRFPAARKGWEAMTLAQRRSHLLAIFHYQGPEARQKRVAKLIEDVLRVARKLGN